MVLICNRIDLGFVGVEYFILGKSTSIINVDYRIKRHAPIVAWLKLLHRKYFISMSILILYL